VDAVEPATGGIVTSNVEQVAERTLAPVVDETTQAEAEPVVETTQAEAEPVEETTETTSTPAVDGKDSQASQDQGEAQLEDAERAETGSPVAERSAPRSLLRDVTTLLEPVTSPIVDAVEPATGGIVTSNVEQVAERTLAPVVDEVVAPVLEPVVDDLVEPVVAPVVEDVVAPVVEPVADEVVAPVVDDVVAPVAAPVVDDVVAPAVGTVTGDVVDPVVTIVTTQALGSVVDEGAAPTKVSTADLLDFSPAKPVGVGAAEQPEAATPAPQMAPMNLERDSSPADESFVAVQPVVDDVAAPAGGPENVSMTAPEAGETGDEPVDGGNDHNPPVSPTSSSGSSANSGGQTSGAGYADIVSGVLIPGIALSTDAVADSVPHILEAILKVSVAPD